MKEETGAFARGLQGHTVREERKTFAEGAALCLWSEQWGGSEGQEAMC